MEAQDNNLISPRNLRATRRQYCQGLEQASGAQVFAAWESAYSAWVDHGMTIAETYRTCVKPHFVNAGHSLSLVIPAFSEAHRVARSIELVKRFQQAFPLSLEVLYVVEQSPDDTLARARAAAADASYIQIIDNGPQRGKGHAVRSGVERAAGDVIMFVDTDLSVPLHHIMLFLERFIRQQEVDVLIGERLRLSARGLTRRALSAAFREAISRVGRLPASWDTQCGFKAFRRDAARRLFELQQTDGFAFDVEILLLARSLGFVVESNAVLWLNDERSTIRPVNDFMPFARDLQRIRHRFADATGVPLQPRVRY